MVIEEPSVMAAVAFMAKLVKVGGGFTAICTPPEMIDQMQILEVNDLEGASKKLLANKQGCSSPFMQKWLSYPTTA